MRQYLWDELKKVTTSTPADNDFAGTADNLLCFAALAACDGRKGDFEMFRETLRKFLRLPSGKKPFQHKRVAELIKRVAMSPLPDSMAGICAYDCLMQWEKGGDKLLGRTIEVWEERLGNHGGARSDENRHGIWAPAIPIRLEDL